MQNKALKKIVAESVHIPPLPQVVLNALRVVDDESASVADLEEIISQEQVLAARVLRIANSAFAGLQRKVDTLFEAVTLLGFNLVRALIVGAALRDMVKHGGSIQRQIWEHCLGVSMASTLIARESRRVKPELALVAGLMHDVGKAAIVNTYPREYADVVSLIRAENADSLQVETDVLGFTHCEVGSRMAKSWKFPQVLETVIGLHHLTRDSQVRTLKGDQASLCQVVSLADDLCLAEGFGFRRLDAVPTEKVTALGFTDEGFAALREEFTGSFSKQRDTLMA